MTGAGGGGLIHAGSGRVSRLPSRLCSEIPASREAADPAWEGSEAPSSAPVPSGKGWGC